MLARARTPVAFLLALTVLSAAAIAAWAPTSNEITSYTDAIATVRTNIATWTSGSGPSTIGQATIVLLKKADRRLAKATSRVGTGPAWTQVSRSLSALEEGAYFLQQSARLERRNTSYLAFVATSGASLYAESRSLALSAANYVQTNYSSKRSTRKLLKSGARVTRAAQKAAATPPRYFKAIRLNNKAIVILGRSGLL